MSLPSTTQRGFLAAGWARALLLFVVFMLLALGCGLFSMYLMHWVDGPPQTGLPFASPRDDRRFVLQLVLHAVLAIGATFLLQRFLNKQPIKALGFPWKGHGREALIGLLLGAALISAGSGILWLTGAINWAYSAPYWHYWLGFTALLVLAAFAEEVVFRGYILTNLLDSTRPMTALGISALLFTAAHIGNANTGALGLLNVFMGGWLLGAGYLLTRNLWFPIFFHVGWNVVQGSVWGYDLSGEYIPHILAPTYISTVKEWTGGHFGFEGSLLCTALLIAGVLILQRLLRR